MVSWWNGRKLKGRYSPEILDEVSCPFLCFFQASSTLTIDTQSRYPLRSAPPPERPLVYEDRHSPLHLADHLALACPHTDLLLQSAASGLGKLSKRTTRGTLAMLD